MRYSLWWWHSVVSCRPVSLIYFRNWSFVQLLQITTSKLMVSVTHPIQFSNIPLFLIVLTGNWPLVSLHVDHTKSDHVRTSQTCLSTFVPSFTKFLWIVLLQEFFNCFLQFVNISSSKNSFTNVQLVSLT